MTKAGRAPGPLAWLPADWRTQMQAWGEPAYRARQVFEWIHRHGVLDPQQMHNLPASLRDRLVELAPGAGSSARVARSDDKTRKLLVALADGRAVETVLLPQLEERETDSPKARRARQEAKSNASKTGTTPALTAGRAAGSRVTLCVSSQVGCAMKCSFCASGIAGLKRQLGADEIVAQVLLARRALEDRERLHAVVFMGMGEPLHNYEAVARSIEVLSEERGLALPRSRITVSTSGLIPEIDRLGQDFGGQVGLAISLHATRDAQRSELMPINRRYPISDLMACLRRYPLSKRQSITVEYTLMRGVNESVAEAERLAELLKGLAVRINLIPVNAVQGASFTAPPWRAVTSFQRSLRAAGLPVFVRKQRGDDIAAACGQLALVGESDLVRRVASVRNEPTKPPS